MKKSFISKKKGWLRAFLGFAAMTAISLSTLSLTACGGSDDNGDIWQDVETDNTEYWGKSLAYLQGVWVYEEDKDNPSADYIKIGEKGVFSSANFLSYGMKSGTIATTINKYNLYFMASQYRETFQMKWLDDQHTRLDVYQVNPSTQGVYESTHHVWVKIQAVPSGWK